MARQELFDRARGRGFADGLGHVESKEIAERQEPADRAEGNMIGVEIVRVRPAEGFDRAVRRPPRALRLRADRGVLAVRFVPNRYHHAPGFGRAHTRR